jgi:hypothetical protein
MRKVFRKKNSRRRRGASQGSGPDQQRCEKQFHHPRSIPAHAGNQKRQFAGGGKSTGIASGKTAWSVF